MSRIFKSIIWGLSLLASIILTIVSATILTVAVFSYSSANNTQDAAKLLAELKPHFTRYIELEKENKKNLGDRTVELAEYAYIERELEDYCQYKHCIHSYDPRYLARHGSMEAAWVADLPAMLERQANIENVAADNRLVTIKVMATCLATFLSLYFLFALAFHWRMGWKRLLTLAALVQPPLLATILICRLPVDPLYGGLDVHSRGNNDPLLIPAIVILLYPFVVLPPVWISIKNMNLTIGEVLKYWKVVR